MRWLKKEWEVSQRAIELIMSADKQAQQEWFQELEKSGVNFLILDRYLTSQQVYATCNGIESWWTSSLQTFMRQPDIEIFIDILPEESIKRKGKYGENDRYESDLQLLTNVRKQYFHFYEDKPYKVFIIDGMQSVEKVHEDIIRVIQSYLME